MRDNLLRIITFCVLLCLLVSFSIFAEESVFGISEDLLRSFEEQRAFEQFMAEKNFQLNNTFPYLQSDLLPIPLNAKYIVVRNPSFSENKNYVIQTNTVEEIHDTERGKLVREYNIFPTSFMDLVLYQNNLGANSFLANPRLGGGFGEYTIEARGTVVNGFKISYGYDTAQDLKQTNTMPSGYETSILTQNAGVELSFLPGMSLNADYKKTTKATGTNEAYKRLNFAYNPGSFARFNAGFGVLSTTHGNSQGTTIFPASANSSQRSNLEDIIVKQLGLSLHPNVYSQLSANYVFVNERGEPVNSSKAVFGLRLGDQSKELSATYQMENKDNHKTTTSAGLELGLVDLASVSAMYSTEENRKYDVGNLRSTVDLGLNFSLAKDSTLHFQYKLTMPEDEPDEEQMAEAKFMIRF